MKCFLFDHRGDIIFYKKKSPLLYHLVLSEKELKNELILPRDSAWAMNSAVLNFSGTWKMFSETETAVPIVIESIWKIHLPRIQVDFLPSEEFPELSEHNV